MSAFICSDYHIGRMAAFLVAERGKYLAYDVALNAKSDRAGQVAAALARENLSSVNHQYQESGGAAAMLAEGVTEAGYVLRCRLAARAGWTDEHTPAQMMKAARCYEYQSCEHPEWNTSQARVLANLVYREAADKLSNDWGPPLSPPTTSILIEPRTCSTSAGAHFKPSGPVIRNVSFEVSRNQTPFPKRSGSIHP